MGDKNYISKIRSAVTDIVDGHTPFALDDEDLLPMQAQPNETPKENPKAVKGIGTVEKNNPFVEAMVQPKSVRTTIAKGTRITGDMVSDGDVDVYGEVNGNITTTGSLTVHGKVNGDMQAATIVVSGSEVTAASIVALTTIVIQKDSVVKANITAKDIEISAKVIGNIAAKGDCSLCSSAHVEGDATAATFAMERGAFLDGKLSIETAKQPVNL